MAGEILKPEEVVSRALENGCRSIAYTYSEPIVFYEYVLDIALAEGLHYVYIGNVPGHPGENTYCPNCHRIIIQRYGYAVMGYHLAGHKCAFCHTDIPGIWHSK